MIHAVQSLLPSEIKYSCMHVKTIKLTLFVFMIDNLITSCVLVIMGYTEVKVIGNKNVDVIKVTLLRFHA